MGGLFDGIVDEWLWFASRWWKDIVEMEVLKGTNWFHSNVVRKVGNGRNQILRMGSCGERPKQDSSQSCRTINR